MCGQVYYATIRGTSFLSVLCHARCTKDGTDCQNHSVSNTNIYLASYWLGINVSGFLILNDF